MSSPQDRLFRKEALERLSSPERLDLLMQVVSPKGWVALACLGGGIVLLVLWSILGRLPVTVNAKGVIVRPHEVVSLQSTGGGRIRELRVKPGDTVKAGDVLAVVEQPELVEQLNQQRARLAELERQQAAIANLQASFADQTLRTIAQQRENVLQLIREAQSLDPVLSQRLAENRRLNQLHAVPVDAALAAEQAFLQNRNRIAELEAQLKELEGKKTSVAQQRLEAEVQRDHQLREMRASGAVLEVQLAQQGRVISQRAGRILEVAVAVGDVIGPGMRIASLARSEAEASLMGVTYFPVSDGKKVRPGMRLQLTPDTVKRERFGGIMGRVVSVSSFPVTEQGLVNTLGNAELARAFAGAGPLIEVVSELERDPANQSGFKWSSSHGPALAVTTGTTGAARVTVEEVPPIVLAFAILRSSSGLY
ncbi:NHLP bacteriocin system secretion protein [bacterium]|nr:NHLP bacteriocin system secretion protein [bacterium]